MSHIRVTAEPVHSKLAAVRLIVQTGIQMKCSLTLPHSIALVFGKVLPLLKFILMTFVSA